jgi:hypothetical protein
MYRNHIAYENPVSQRSGLLGRAAHASWNLLRAVISWMFKGGSSGSICL